MVAAPSEQQISMQTTMDLLMRLLDDIDAGIPITPLRTAQLRRMLLQTGGGALSLTEPQHNDVQLPAVKHEMHILKKPQTKL